MGERVRERGQEKEEEIKREIRTKEEERKRERDKDKRGRKKDRESEREIDKETEKEIFREGVREIKPTSTNSISDSKFDEKSVVQVFRTFSNSNGSNKSKVTRKQYLLLLTHISTYSPMTPCFGCHDIQ
jgi:hypothetical protein